MTDRVRAQFPDKALDSGIGRRETLIGFNRNQPTGLFQGWGPRL